MELPKDSTGAQASSLALTAARRGNRDGCAPVRFRLSRRGTSVRPRRRLKLAIRLALTVAILVMIAITVFFTHSYRSYARIVDARIAHGYLTSRAGIYGAPR